jgi:hypothetical protein
MEKIILVNAVETSSQPSSSEINLDSKKALERLLKHQETVKKRGKGEALRAQGKGEREPHTSASSVTIFKNRGFIPLWDEGFFLLTNVNGTETDPAEFALLPLPLPLFL